MEETDNYYNPIMNYFIDLIINDVDISNLSDNNIIQEIKIILLSLGVKEDELTYLNFSVGVNNVKYKIIPHNIITALWFSGLNPQDKETTHKYNQFKYNGKIYTYDNMYNNLNIIDDEE